ncbi:hypothetical protein GYMLUDRAFT_65214 [Collybiopsis luxurians FD-317 M1]|uniref:Uncharacterized protein n=1 Tax=Collybiopsis luxurians FD-317 M1 TaxID=944289 RepID=A0A0D0BYR9_9AGAR|nr:hypothetical protein GYMLUDRAFT_65214 [Collybiopsis luxurians FD-317 M1]
MDWVSEAEKLQIHIHSDVWVGEKGDLEPIVKLYGPRNSEVVAFASALVKHCGFKVQLEFQDLQIDGNMGENGNNTVEDSESGNDNRDAGKTGEGNGSENDSGNTSGNGDGNGNGIRNREGEGDNHESGSDSKGRNRGGNGNDPGSDNNGRNGRGNGNGKGNRGGEGGGNMDGDGNGNKRHGGGGGGDEGDNKAETSNGNKPYIETAMEWAFPNMTNQSEIPIFNSRIRFRFPAEKTEAQRSEDFPQDHRGSCKIRLEELHNYWRLKMGLVHVWTGPNTVLTISHDQTNAAQSVQDGYNVSVQGQGGPTGPTITFTGGKTHNTTTQIVRPFKTISTAGRHGSRGKALQVIRGSDAGLLTGDPELDLKLIIHSAQDQIVSIDIQTYWRVAPVRRKSNNDNQDQYKSLEALFICHQLAISNIFSFFSHTYNDKAQRSRDGTDFKPQNIFLGPRVAAPEHKVQAGAKTRSMPKWKDWKGPFNSDTKKIMDLDMILFRYENGESRWEED